MLTDPAQSVQDVAYALGLRHARHLLACFRRWTGMAPTTFRASL